MDFEGFHMDEIWAPWINAGKVMVFSIDTMDKESWSDQNGDPYWRIRRHEQWIHYIVDEMVPFIRAMANNINITSLPAYGAGDSMVTGQRLSLPCLLIHNAIHPCGQ